MELLIDARPRDLGGFTVRRVLPSAQRRLVGPFIERAKADWKAGKFPKVPGDGREFIPLPE